MAKKKSESADNTPAEKTAAKKAPVKKSAPSVGSSEMTINTTAAASAAAALIGNRVNLTGAPGSIKPESAAFKAMKQNLATPNTGVANLLPQAGGAKKSNAPFEKTKQVGHNQTFSADVNRAGVPRRTGGG